MKYNDNKKKKSLNSLSETKIKKKFKLTFKFQSH